MAEDEFYTIEEIASKLKVTRQTVSNWIREGRLKSIKAGRARRIPAAAYEQFIKDSDERSSAPVSASSKAA